MIPSSLTATERRALSELRRRLDDLLGPRLDRMVLFGSKARGDAEADSDTDVAIIVEGLDRELKRQILDVVTEVELDHLITFSTLILSTTELKRMKDRELRLADDLDREGVPL